MNGQIAIAKANVGRFGKRPETLLELAREAASPILEAHREQIDYILVANAYSGEFNNLSGVNYAVASYLGLPRVRSEHVDAISGSGGVAVWRAQDLILSGKAESVLVIGAEKMTEKQTPDGKTDVPAVTSIISSLLPHTERDGMTLPGVGALMAQEYAKKYGMSKEALAWVAVKNHQNGAHNPKAQYQTEMSIQEVLGGRVVKEPLTVFEICPISDGAAALLLTSGERARQTTSKPVYINGMGYATDTAYLSERGSMTSVASLEEAAKQAYRAAGMTAKEIKFAELHDMSTILEIVQSEDLGFFGRGEGWKAALEGKTRIDGELPINASGGLNSKGHPIGASGVAQIAELYSQIRGEAEDGQRQIKNADTGLAVSLAGFGNGAIVTICSNRV